MWIGARRWALAEPGTTGRLLIFKNLIILFDAPDMPTAGEPWATGGPRVGAGEVLFFIF
jgi:hypothetical protein